MLSYIKKMESKDLYNIKIYKESNKSTYISFDSIEKFKITYSDTVCHSVDAMYKNQSCSIAIDGEIMSVDNLVSILKLNAPLNLKNQNNYFPKFHNRKYVNFKKTKNEFLELSEDNKIELLNCIKEEIFKCIHVEKILNLSYTENISTREVFMSGLTFPLIDSNSFSYLSLEIFVNIAGQRKIISNDCSLKLIEEFDYLTFCKETIKKCNEVLCEKTVKNGKYKIIIKPSVLCDLLEILVEHFNGEMVMNGTSIFNINSDCIFSNNITIIDDPFMENGLRSTFFDDEGTPCEKTVIVEKGRLNSFLHNNKTSIYFKCNSTGNGFNSGYNSPISVHSTNLYICPCNGMSFNMLLKIMNDGIIISEAFGVSSSFDLNGNFSLRVNGYRVNNSTIISKINSFCITGNIKELLNNVLQIGEDISFNNASIGCPSILFDKQNVIFD